jgi:hypothetical protein
MELPVSRATRASPRSTREVFEDHLRCRRAGAVEEDLARNYADDVVLLTGLGLFRGKDGVRQSAHALLRQLPCFVYEYRTKLVEGELAFLEWSGRCATGQVEDGADSFWVRGGRIVAQTIHYTVQHLPEG